LFILEKDTFAFNEPYLSLFEFIHEQFKLLLPEEIAPFGQSIKTLLQKIKEGINKDKNDLLNNIVGLSNQIKKFTTAVINNTNSLLKKSKNLKANVERMDYIEKIRTSTSLIEKYITPLNNILGPNHSESIYNELKNVSEFANTRRFNDGNGEKIRRKFEGFYHFVNRIMNKLTEQSNSITTELTPLLERIKTESEYIKGFHLYLTDSNCYKIKPLRVFITARYDTYTKFI